MKHTNLFVSAVLVAAFAGLVADAAVPPPGKNDASSHAGQSAKGLRLPLQRYPSNGRVKELLTADNASVDADGIIHASGRIQLFQFDEDGKTNTLAVGKTGFFDPARNYAECHGPVALLRPGIALSGTNLTWISELNILRIETNAVLRLYQNGKSAVGALSK